MKGRPVLERVVTGRVSDPRGIALKDIRVQWIHSWGKSKGREIAVTDKRGSYRLEFVSEKETHPISVFGEGWSPVIRGGVRTGTPERPARVDFTLEAGHWLEGRVVDEEKRPVPGVVVGAMPALGGWDSRPRCARRRSSPPGSGDAAAQRGL